MSWLYSRALAEEFSAANSRDGKSSAPWSAPNIQEMCLSHGRTTEASSLSQYGMTCGLLTESRGEELLMWFREDFLARTSASRDGERDLAADEVLCGLKCSESSGRSIRNMCSSKTARCSANVGECMLSEDLPNWGMTRNGELFPLKTAAHRTHENASGAWLPTPLASDGSQHLARQKVRSERKTKFGAAKSSIPYWLLKNHNARLHPKMSEWVMGFPDGWSDLQPLETRKFRKWQESHGIRFHSNPKENEK